MTAQTNAMYDAATFEEFWLHYKAAHENATVRSLHAVATSSAILLALLALKRRSLALAVAAPIVDYAIAQLAHRREGGHARPYRKPWWHLRAEWRLYRETLRVG